MQLYCLRLLQGRHTWGKKVEVGDVCCHIQVIDSLKVLGILIGENVGSYEGAEC